MYIAMDHALAGVAVLLIRLSRTLTALVILLGL